MYLGLRLQAAKKENRFFSPLEETLNWRFTRVSLFSLFLSLSIFLPISLFLSSLFFFSITTKKIPHLPLPLLPLPLPFLPFQDSQGVIPYAISLFILKSQFYIVPPLILFSVGMLSPSSLPVALQPKRYGEYILVLVLVVGFVFGFLFLFLLSFFILILLFLNNLNCFFFFFFFFFIAID